MFSVPLSVMDGGIFFERRETTTMNMKTEQQAAEMLGCSVAALRKWRWLGKGPVYCKVGRLVRYGDADLVAYLDANRVQPAGAAR